MGTQDFGRRPYIKKGVKDYQDMMWRTPSKTFWNVKAEKQSEFEKPYAEDGYNEMEHFEAPPSGPPFSMPWPGIGPQPGPEGVPGAEGACTIAMEPFTGNIWDEPVVVFPVDQCTKFVSQRWQSYYTYVNTYSVGGHQYIENTTIRGQGPKLYIWLKACDDTGYATIWVDGNDLCGNICWTWAHPNCCINNPDFLIDEDLSDEIIEPGGDSAEIYLDQDNPGVPVYTAEIIENAGDTNHYFLDSGLTLQELEVWEKPAVGIPLFEVWAHADACGSVEVKITDACGTEYEKFLRTTAGSWSAKTYCCYWEVKSCDPDIGYNGPYYTNGQDARYAIRNTYDYLNKRCCGTCCTPAAYESSDFACDPTQDNGWSAKYCFCGAARYKWQC